MRRKSRRKELKEGVQDEGEADMEGNGRGGEKE